MSEHGAGHFIDFAILAFNNAILGRSTYVSKFTPNAMDKDVLVKRSGGKLTTFIGAKNLDLVCWFFLHHGVPLMESGQSLCFRGEELNLCIVAIIIDQVHKISRATKRGILLWTTQICTNDI